MGERFRFETTDGVVGQIKRRLRSEGVAFDDIDEAIAAELGISLDAWWAHGVVLGAVDRYQMQQFFAYLGREHPEMARGPAVGISERVGETNPGNGSATSIGSPPGNATKRTER
jgi:hypothetical protein